VEKLKLESSSSRNLVGSPTIDHHQPDSVANAPNRSKGAVAQVVAFPRLPGVHVGEQAEVQHSAQSGQGDSPEALHQGTCDPGSHRVRHSKADHGEPDPGDAPSAGHEGAGEVHGQEGLLQADEHRDGQHQDLAALAEQVYGHCEELQAGHSVAGISALDSIAADH